MEALKSSAISASARKQLWDYLDERFVGVGFSGSGLPQDPSLDAVVAELGLSRSQAKRQWDRWRRGRRDRLGDEGGDGDSEQRRGGVDQPAQLSGIRPPLLPLAGWLPSSAAHEHSGSTHAHRRRAFGADDEKTNPRPASALTTRWIPVTRAARLP